MSVNSASRGFFENRLVVSVRVAVVIFAVFFITMAFTKRSDRDLRAKEVNLMIRQIGDRLLQQSGDFTSRVLPVTEIKEGTFLVAFENEFIFNHDSLMVLSQRLLPKTQFPAGYTVTVHACMTDVIVYGFQINNTSPDILACRGRNQPSGCYTIEFSFPNFYTNVEGMKDEHKKPDIHLQAEEVKTVKVHAEEANPKLEEAKSVSADLQNVNSKFKEPKSTTSGYHPSISLIYVGMLVLLGVTFSIVRFRKVLTPAPLPNQNHAVAKVSVREMPALGKFLFDVKTQHLLLGTEMISLTDKECRILELLNQRFGELIPRETLMQKIWLDEGVITGRSLDMFVSKLRKKLSRDPDLRITNVHGKGYKLEVPGIQILKNL